MKDTLNARVKFREPFRPFGASVMAEHSREYFAATADMPYMLFAVDALPERRADIPAVVHVDGSCRIQTVRAEDNARYHRLLGEVLARTGVPMVINTSFNIKGEPIVETPDDAVKCFASCDMDLLVLGDFIVEKEPLAVDGVPNPKVLDLPVDFARMIELRREQYPGGRTIWRLFAPHPIGRQGQPFAALGSITEAQSELIAAVDGRRTLREIVGSLCGDLEREAAGELFDLCWTLHRKGMIAFSAAPSPPSG